jgi:hypothetical protein
MRLRSSLALVLVASAVFACSAAAADVPRWKVWLCSPTVARDWCDTSLAITVYDAKGTGSVQAVTAPRTRPVDCFYVYPTVSQQRRGNSTLEITAEEKNVALTQAAQFGRVCRIFAPMYRQTTAWRSQYESDRDLAYRDVLAAWRDYLAHHNKGRGVVLLGHSQGASHLRRLISEEIDLRASVRKLLVSAILLGSGVSVGKDSDVGGDFTKVPACRKADQTGCVVAFSSWSSIPSDRGGGGGFGSSQGDERDERELCVNPAALAGGKAPITPVFVWYASGGLVGDLNPRPPTTYISFPGLYTARCVERGSRAWLLVERVTSPLTDPRPTVVEVNGEGRGLHPADVNVALANLLVLVRSQAKAWVASR